MSVTMVKRHHKKIARRRMDHLFEQAKKAAVSGEMDRADRYVEIARRMGMRYNVPLRSYQKRRVCKRCYSYLHPGVSCRVRLKDGMVITLCKTCKTINRFVYDQR